ncbi:MAG: YihY/virulence factor BrkB family protein, partial [Verrucomicrobia bacterium]|nr:YihY/virulence factor BrkB family protein [Verrucomicrobiota bacterium]
MRPKKKDYEQSKFGRVWNFLADEVWDVELTSMNAIRRFGVTVIRVVHLIFRGYREDECPLHAAALTFNTLMSIVPVLALSLSIAKGFGAGDVVQSKMQHVIYTQLSQFQATPVAATNAATETTTVSEASMDVVTNVAAILVGVADGTESSPSGDTAVDNLVDQLNGLVDQIFGYVEQINFRALGGVGLTLLVWSVISVLGRVESSFNRVWGVTTERTLLRKFTDYMGVLILMPFLILISSSLPAIDLVHRFLPDSAG